MVSSPGRSWMVRTATSLPSGRLEDVAGADCPGAQDGSPHRELPLALPGDGLEDRGVAADPARLGAGDHDAPRHRKTEPEPDGAQVRLAPLQPVLTVAVEHHVGAEPAAVPRAERARRDEGQPDAQAVVEGARRTLPLRPLRR